MELPRIARKQVEVDVAAVLPNGDPATVTGASFAICDHGGPTAATVWLPPDDFNDVTRVALVTLAGREAANKAGALVLTMARGELWALPDNAGYLDAGFVDTLEGL